MATSAALLRSKIEAALADRIPSALTPAQRIIKPVAPTGIESIDKILNGGLPLGAITEVVGPESSGRTSLAMSYTARMTQSSKVCAWIDVSNTLDPESAAANGIQLEWLLWVRCGRNISRHRVQTAEDSFALPEKYLVPAPVIKGLHGGGYGPHPRSEIKGLSEAVGSFLQPVVNPAKNIEQPRIQSQQQLPLIDPSAENTSSIEAKPAGQFASRRSGLQQPWTQLEQALRVTDLLLQAGGFSAIVLDMGSIAPAQALRVPLATWFRYRAAAERSQASILLLTQHSCAKSSVELLLRLEAGHAQQEEPTLFTGMEYRLEVSRDRHPSLAQAKVVPLRKPPQSERKAQWSNRSAWAGAR